MREDPDALSKTRVRHLWPPGVSDTCFRECVAFVRQDPTPRGPRCRTPGSGSGGRSGDGVREVGRMSRAKRRRTLRPKTPSRIRKKRAAKPRDRGRSRGEVAKPRSRHHPELWGLGLVALGAFLGSVLYFGWNGGYVRRALADGPYAPICQAA